MCVSYQQLVLKWHWGNHITGVIDRVYLKITTLSGHQQDVDVFSIALKSLCNCKIKVFFIWDVIELNISSNHSLFQT